ncbi:MAG: hypothetical protein ACTSX8_00520 [Alphaproteobacteria bacterium]
MALLDKEKDEEGEATDSAFVGAMLIAEAIQILRAFLKGFSK